MSVVQQWNALAEGAIAWAASAALASTVLFVVAAIVWLAVRRRASAHLGHVLFLVPLVPLALPHLGTVRLPSWAFPVALADAGEEASALVHRPAPAPTHAQDVPVLEFVELDAEPPLAAGALAARRSPAPTWKAWTLLSWAVVAVGLVARLVGVQRRTHRLLRDAPELDGPEGARVRSRLRRLMPRLGLSRPLRVVEAPALPTPAVWGLSRPVLAIERRLVASLDREQLDWVLLHELAHLARRDLARGAAQRLVQVLWFFHPLVWLAGRAADELREAACDEAAMSVAGPSRRTACAKALVEVAAHGAPRNRQALLLTLQEDKARMKKRILRMLDSNRVPARRPSFAGLALCGLLVGSSLVDVTLAQEEEILVVEELDESLVDLGSFTEQEVRAAIDRSLDWLLAQQAEDGHWPTGPGTEADTGEFNSIGVTGLVLTSLGEAQRRDRLPERAHAIERGRAFLAGVQRDDGLFGSQRGHTYMQSHAVATRAWLRTRPAGNEDAWRPAAERAVGVILRARTPYMGWRFDLVPLGDCDTFTTGLMLAALREARDAGIEVPEDAWREPLEYIDRVTEPSNGRTGYDSRGGNDARLAAKGDEFPAELTQLSTAVGIRTRMDWGEDPGASQVILRGAFLLTEFAPRWDEDAGSIDYYYWLFGTRALAPIGGAMYEQWRGAVVAALVPNQVQDRDGGWWPAIDAWATEGTRVHATAVCTLALQNAF